MASTWRQPPLFEAPEPDPVELSRALAVFENRLDEGEEAKWTEVKLKSYRPCQECAHMQHESAGRYHPRRQAKRRRRHPMGPTLELCHAHADLWRQRDEADSGLARSTKRRSAR